MALERNDKQLSPPLKFKLIKYTAPIISAVKRIFFERDSDAPTRGGPVSEDVTGDCVLLSQ